MEVIFDKGFTISCDTRNCEQCSLCEKVKHVQCLIQRHRAQRLTIKAKLKRNKVPFLYTELLKRISEYIAFRVWQGLVAGFRPAPHTSSCTFKLFGNCHKKTEKCMSRRIIIIVSCIIIIFISSSQPLYPFLCHGEGTQWPRTHCF